MTRFSLIIYFLVPIGFTDKTPDNQKIMNGRDAHRGQFPFMISIQRLGMRKSLCGGALIASDWVLTAAHCSVALGLNMVLVAGTVNSVKFDKGYQERRVKSIYYPGNSSGPGILNDISLVRPNKRFTRTKFIKVLPYQRCDVSIGDRVLIMGWGTFNKSGEMAKILQWAEAKTNEFDVCGGDAPLLNHSGFACIRGDNKKLTMARKGDSGSPGIYRGKIFGVVSMGISMFSYGSLYTKTSPYHDWIVSIVPRNGNGEEMRTLYEAVSSFLIVSSFAFPGLL